MAVSYANLWPKVVAWENLLLAYAKARRGKRHRPDVAAFEARREAELLDLRDELRSGAWRPGPYRHFTIRRPKERRISAAPFRDRVVHHAVVNVLEPLFEERFVHDSYACRLGKGTHRALSRAARYLRSRRFVLQCDVQKFFPSVDHEVLLGIVARRVRDRDVLDLLARILASGAGVLEDQAPCPYFPGDDLFACLRPRGLPIGNLTSQFLANVILDVLDHEVAEEIRPGGYVRYCDDFLLFDDDRDLLREARRRVDAELTRLRLHLHPTKTFVKPCAAGISFLGYRLHRGGIRLLRGAIARANARLRAQARALRGRRADPEAVRASVASWLGHARRANSTAIRRRLLQRHGLEWAAS